MDPNIVKVEAANTDGYLTSTNSDWATAKGAASGGTASGDTDTALETTLIATLGNSTAFGDLNTGRRVYGALSDAHGGLG